MQKLFNKSVLTKGFLLFILFSVGIQIGILLWTTDQETWKQLNNFQWYFIIILLVLGTLRWLLDGMFFVAAAKHGSKSSVKVWKATIIRLETSVIASIVPVLVGTLPMHAYLLHKQKMTVSESMAITMLRAILPIFLFLLNIPILLFMKTDLESGKFFNKILEVISLPLVAIVVFMVITLFFPHTIKNLASTFIRLWGRIKIIHIQRILAIEERLFHEIDQFSENLWTYIRTKKYMFIMLLGWIFLAYLTDYFIAITILWGFGFKPPLIQAVFFQFLIRPIIFLAPTPGGTGIWDFTYLGFFSLFMPHHLIGISVLMWRMLLSYIPIIIGSFFLTHDFHKDEKLRNFIVKKKDYKDGDRELWRDEKF
jgi:uncharacterized protein (TIRG00374 family)